MKKHISKLLVCCLALGAILIPTASAAEGIYEDFTYVDFFFTGMLFPFEITKSQNVVE